MSVAFGVELVKDVFDLFHVAVEEPQFLRAVLSGMDPERRQCKIFSHASMLVALARRGQDELTGVRDMRIVHAVATLAVATTLIRLR
jgi:hypothetical protein